MEATTYRKKNNGDFGQIDKEIKAGLRDRSNRMKID